MGQHSISCLRFTDELPPASDPDSSQLLVWYRLGSGEAPMLHCRPRGDEDAGPILVDYYFQLALPAVEGVEERMLSEAWGGFV